MRSSGSESFHEPVLVREVVSLLAPRPSGLYVDGTVGLGGHLQALLEAGAGRVIAIDRDDVALAQTRARVDASGIDGNRVVLVHGDYRQLGKVLEAQSLTAVDGIVIDLGVSSMQLDDPERGFSFRRAGPLDMRMNRATGPTLAAKLATVDAETLADVIFRFGEERRSRQVARAILAARDRGALNDTAELASAVRRAAGHGTWQRLDPATRTFQALRIWVNDELDGLELFLDAASALLAPGGRLVVIAFHSLEDRVVKHTMRRLAQADSPFRLVMRRSVVPEADESERNPRSRSARLRALERVA
ncbi:MAG: 16S rRNA (cytosine(1402)-N(4))-methyltransferase RsmH [Acidobacteriota bacterium]